MKKVLKILILIIVLFIYMAIFGFADSSDGNYDVEAKSKLVIGDDINYPPYSYLDSEGQATGFNVEIAKAVGKAMGYDVEIRLDEWNTTRKALENGELDAIAGMFYSEKRQAVYSFSSKHSITNGDIFTHKKTKLESIQGLKGKAVVVQKGDIIAEYLKGLELDINLVEVPTVDEALKLVELGTYDYAGLSKLPGIYSINNNKFDDIHAKNLMINPNDYSMVVKKGNENLLLILESGLQVIKATGEYDQIYYKWLGVYEDKDLSSYLWHYKWIILLVAFIIIILLGLSLTLKHIVNIKTQELQEINKDLSEKNEFLTISEEKLIAQVEEIDSQKEYITFLAYHDTLTNLPNRRKFIEELTKALSVKSQGAVILLDIDNFKGINDTMGHAYGDKILVEISRKLKTIANENIFISRFSGDEFLILLKKIGQIEGVSLIAKKINQVLNEKIVVDENEIEITASIGISIFPGDSIGVNQLIMNADLALYTVKKFGKNGYKFFDKDMTALVEKKSYIETIIRDAIDNDGFKLVYQPQVNLSTGEVHAYEALLRLKNYPILPGEFIPITEENGMIIKVGRIVTQKVIGQISEWQKQGLRLIPISINFSASQLRDSTYLDFVVKQLEEYRVNPQYIEIEITENIFLENKKQTRGFLRKLKEIGIKISIDDFGTGYSSLSYLTYLEISKVKIDRSLSIGFLESKNNKVMDSLVALFQSLNLEVVAEGIETYEQCISLKGANCDYIQGYYFSKPLEVEAVGSKSYLIPK